MRLKRINPFRAIDKYIHKGFLDSDGKERKFGSSYTSDDWVRYNEYGKEKHPYIHKFITIIGKIDTWFAVKSMQLTDPYWYLYHRFYKKSHMIDSKLDKGRWYETGHLMLHAMMSELAYYIEEIKDGYPWELKELDKKNKGLPNSIDGEDENSIGMADSQWKDMKEAYEIYSWWKNDFPKKEKAVDDINNERKHTYHGGDMMKILSDRTHSEHNMKVYEKHRKAEKELTDETTEMLIRLIKVRDGLLS